MNPLIEERPCRCGKCSLIGILSKGEILGSVFQLEDSWRYLDAGEAGFEYEGGTASSKEEAIEKLISYHQSLQ